MVTLGKVEKYDNDGKKKDKKSTKKAKKGAGKGGKAEISPAPSRMTMSSRTLHTSSIQASSEEDFEEDDEEDGERNASGDFSTYIKKKGESKIMPTG